MDNNQNPTGHSHHHHHHHVANTQNVPLDSDYLPMDPPTYKQSEPTYSQPPPQTLPVISPLHLEIPPSHNEVDVFPTPAEALTAPGAGPKIKLIDLYNQKIVAHNDSGKRKVPTQDQMEAHKAKAILLTCMDFRLLDDMVYFMKHVGYHNNYDQCILAGASLGFNQDQFPEWPVAFKKHVELAEKLHSISEIIVMDHSCCGAYKLIYGELTPDQERTKHFENILAFEKIMKGLHPTLKLHGYLMALDGTVEKLN